MLLYKLRYSAIKLKYWEVKLEVVCVFFFEFKLMPQILFTIADARYVVSVHLFSSRSVICNMYFVRWSGNAIFARKNCAIFLRFMRNESRSRFSLMGIWRSNRQWENKCNRFVKWERRWFFFCIRRRYNMLTCASWWKLLAAVFAGRLEILSFFLWCMGTS